jgi:dienelactone hydrolase
MTHQGNLAANSGSQRSRYRMAVAGLLLLGLATASLGTATAQATSASHSRGSVVSYAKVARLSLSKARAYLRAAGYDTPKARSGLTMYRIIYRTISSRGKPDTASGVLALPDNSRRTLPTVVFEHGTMAAKADAASVAPDSRAEVMLLAGAGYAAVEPDYLGLGLGPGRHPYLDPASEATASVDMLRAARVVAERVHRQLESKIMVTGFSQGGQAALAFAHALQHGVGSRLRLGAVAGISGPYDVQHAELPAALDGTLNPKLAAFYVAYWVTSMNKFHHLYAHASQAFKAPYDKTMPKLFDGSHSDQSILAALPDSPQQLLTKRFLTRLTHPTGEIQRLLRSDDTTCTSWVPRAPVRLYAAHADTQVAFLNAVHCQRALDASGLHVPLINVGNVDHFPSEHIALPRIVRWFERLQPA